jgi:hypothetical protein
LSVGAVHTIVIDVSEEALRVGVPGAKDNEAAIAENVVETGLSPTTFLAFTLNL